MRTKSKSIDALLHMIEQAQAEQTFDIAADIKLLLEKYTKLSKRDYLQLLARLLDKYTATEQTAVHAALLVRCKAGDVNAIRLYQELRSSASGAGEEVQIIDDL